MQFRTHGRDALMGGDPAKGPGPEALNFRELQVELCGPGQKVKPKTAFSLCTATDARIFQRCESFACNMLGCSLIID